MLSVRRPHFFGFDVMQSRDAEPHFAIRACSTARSRDSTRGSSQPQQPVLCSAASLFPCAMSAQTAPGAGLSGRRTQQEGIGSIAARVVAAPLDQQTHTFLHCNLKYNANALWRWLHSRGLCCWKTWLKLCPLHQSCYILTRQVFSACSVTSLYLCDCSYSSFTCWEITLVMPAVCLSLFATVASCSLGAQHIIRGCGLQVSNSRATPVPQRQTGHLITKLQRAS